MRPRCSPPTRSPVVDASIVALESLGDWNAEAIEQALRGALIEGLGLKPKVAFGPVRVAVTGRRVSPPLFESLEILGRGTTALSACRRLGRRVSSAREGLVYTFPASEDRRAIGSLGVWGNWQPN